MSNKNHAPNEKKQALEGEISFEETREYLSQLLKRVYSDHDVATDDAIALASLATSLDKFLASSETERQSALTLKNELSQIACNSNRSNREKIKSNSQNRTESITEKTFYTNDGRVVYLGTMLGSGGEGAVYKVPNMPGKVVKVFKSTTDFAYMERKIEALINNQIPSKLDHVLINTIPESLLYDEDDHFVGYIMPGITTRFKLYDVSRNSADRTKYFPELDYKGLIIIAYNLAEAVSYIHEHEVVIGDLNPNNIVVNPDGTVCLIDTDSYDIVDKTTNEHFPCAVGLPEMLAPELQNVGYLKNTCFTRETDLFSLAILIFRLLMNNANPFGGVRSDLVSRAVSDTYTNVEIMNGESPYIKKIEGLTVPDWAPPFSMLPEYIQDLFVRVFDYNQETYLEKIKERPTTKEWMDALMRFYNEPLKQCEKNHFHWYRKELDQCPLCAKENPPKSAKKKGIFENLSEIITIGI